MIKCWLLKFFKVCLLCTFFIKNKQIKLSNANFKFNRRLWHRSQGNLKSKISEHAYTHTYIVCLSSLTQKPFRILENESRTYVRVGKYFLFSSNRELIQKKNRTLYDPAEGSFSSKVNYTTAKNLVMFAQLSWLKIFEYKMSNKNRNEPAI